MPFQLGAERGLRIIDRDVRHATAQLEQQLLRATRGLVLDDGVGQSLLGQRILQLKVNTGRPLMKITKSSSLPESLL